MKSTLKILAEQEVGVKAVQLTGRDTLRVVLCNGVVTLMPRVLWDLVGKGKLKFNPK